MKNFSLAGLALTLCCACTPAAKVSCVVDGAPDKKIVVKHLEPEGFGLVDTLKTDAKGECRFKVSVSEGQPEFIYLYYNEVKIASLLLKPGQKAVRVTADTLGRYSVEGSASSEELQRTEQAFAAFSGRLAVVSNQQEYVKEYVAYYRDCVKYVVEHPCSMTSIPVLYQKINAGAPIFAQSTDAMHFRKVCDSLKLRYPESKYVKALERETVRRENAMRLEHMINNTAPSSFPGIELPDINGNKVSLDSVRAKAVLVHFWDSSDPMQKMMNVDVLLPLYKEYHSKEFEIYSVCLDADKVRWGTVVKAQRLPWINVCDGMGVYCPAVSAYNVSSLPYSVLINENGIVSASISGESGLRKELSRLLK